MSEGEWYYYLEADKKQHGPVSAQELASLAQAGTLKATDKVWKDGMPDWVPANRVKGLPFSAPTEPATQRTAPNPFPQDMQQPHSMQPGMGTPAFLPTRTPGAFKFPDLDFQYFISTKVIRILWILHLAATALALVGFLMYFMYLLVSSDFHIAPVIGLIAVPIFLAFNTLFTRIWLELIIVFFRIAEHLREMNDKMTPAEG